jgi:hypothetical protein
MLISEPIGHRTVVRKVRQYDSEPKIGRISPIGAIDDASGTRMADTRYCFFIGMDFLWNYTSGVMARRFPEYLGMLWRASSLASKLR